jgi:hypothetical protein
MARKAVDPPNSPLNLPFLPMKDCRRAWPCGAENFSRGRPADEIGACERVGDAIRR